MENTDATWDRLFKAQIYRHQPSITGSFTLLDLGMGWGRTVRCVATRNIYSTSNPVPNQPFCILRPPSNSTHRLHRLHYLFCSTCPAAWQIPDQRNPWLYKRENIHNSCANFSTAFSRLRSPPFPFSGHTITHRFCSLSLDPGQTTNCTRPVYISAMDITQKLLLHAWNRAVFPPHAERER